MEQRRPCPVCGKWRWWPEDEPDADGHHPDCGVNLLRQGRARAERDGELRAREGRFGMAGYLIGQITVKDPELWQRYTEGVRDSLEPFGAEVVFRGRRASLLAGEHDKELAVVIRFADQDTLLRWFWSDAYQELIPLRERAADVVIVGYEEAG